MANLDRKRVGGRTVVVTGASAGVGRATAWAFAREGARIALLARDPARLEAVRREVRDLGGTGLPIPTDVADAEGVEAAAAKTEAEWGPIDVWVNNAMASVFSTVAEMTPEDYKRVTEVTYLGCVHGTLAALRRMRPRNRGVIVQVGSALAYRAIPLQSAYCAAKHAVKGFTESLRTELLHDRSGVRVTMVHLPAHNTPQFRWVKSRLPHKAMPVPPIYQPEVAARAVLWASYHPRREYLVGWPTWRAVLGEKFAPGYADRYLARMGYDSQQTADPEDPGRPNNLLAPAPGDPGAHGVFDHLAWNRSPFAWLELRWRPLAAAGLAVACVLALLKRKDRPSCNRPSGPRIKPHSMETMIRRCLMILSFALCAIPAARAAHAGKRNPGLYWGDATPARGPLIHAFIARYGGPRPVFDRADWEVPRRNPRDFLRMAALPSIDRGGKEAPLA